MEKNLKKSTSSEIESLLKIITNGLFNMRNSLDESKLQRFFDNLRRGMLAQKAHATKNNENFDRVDKVIDSYEAMIKEKGIINEIKTSGMSQKEFLEAHREAILGDHKRKYNMSDLYNETLIKKANKWTDRKRVMLNPNDFGVEYHYLDSTGKKITITDLGSLEYQEWNDIRYSLNLYRVQRKSESGLDYDCKVLSNIIIPEMSQDEYKNAVLNELLSENNISLSNCGGYIGEIIRKPKEDTLDIVGGEKQDENSYEYRVNNSYVLAYDATAVSAAIDFKRNEDRITENIAKANKQKQQEQKSETGNKKNTNEQKTKSAEQSYDGIAGR